VHIVALSSQKTGRFAARVQLPSGIALYSSPTMPMPRRWSRSCPSGRDISGGECPFERATCAAGRFAPPAPKPAERRQRLAHAFAASSSQPDCVGTPRKTGHAFAVITTHRFFGIPFYAAAKSWHRLAA